MKKLLVMVLALMSTMMLHAQSKVYMTKEISPEALVRIYKALGVPAHGHVAIKISSGEMGGNNYLKPTLIRNLVDEVNGTLVECCTAYGVEAVKTRESIGRPSMHTVLTPSLPSI